MPLGVQELRALGVRLPPERGAPFLGIRFIDGNARAEGRFGHGPGLGIRRTALSEAMLARARELGAEIRFGEAVTGFDPVSQGRVRVQVGARDLEARLLVGADGLHSRIRRAAGLAAPPRGCLRHGMRRHFRAAPQAPFVEVHWTDGAEAYVTPVGREEIGVALLWGGAATRYAELLERFPRLARRLSGAEPTSPVEGAARLHERAVRRFAPGVALVGDAAGHLDPLTGEGVTLGLRCARSLVDAVARGAPLGDYERAYRALSRGYYWMTGLLLEVGARPWLRRRLIAALVRQPELFDRLLAISSGEAPPRALGLFGALRLAGGLARTAASGA